MNFLNRKKWLFWISDFKNLQWIINVRKHSYIYSIKNFTFSGNSENTAIKTNSVCVKSDKVPISFQSSASFQFSKDSFLLKRLCWDEDVTFSKGFLWKTLKWSLFIDNIEIFILGAIHAHKPFRGHRRGGRGGGGGYLSSINKNFTNIVQTWSAHLRLSEYTCFYYKNS